MELCRISLGTRPRPHTTGRERTEDTTTITLEESNIPDATKLGHVCKQATNNNPNALSIRDHSLGGQLSIHQCNHQLQKHRKKHPTTTNARSNPKRSFVPYFSKSHPVDIPLSPRCRSVVLTRIRLALHREVSSLQVSS